MNSAQRLIAKPLALMLVLSTCVVLTVAVPVHGKEADKDQALYATADSLLVDDAKGVSVFTGNVVITKGSIAIKADRFEVREGADGAQIGIATAKTGSVASFAQDRDIDNESIRGSAQRIDYNSLTERLELTGKAVLQRFRGDTMADETSGERIVYTAQDAKFVVDGSVSGALSGSRVRAVLAPKSAVANTASPTGQPALPAPSADPAN